MPTDDRGVPPDALSPAPSARRYTEQEVALVIKRAAEMQAQGEQASEPDTSGLSLVELEQIAREAGIDPALVRRAAQDIDTRHSTAPASPFFGAPSVITLERTVEGEVPADEYEAIVDELRRAFNDNGQISTLGRTLAWSSTRPYGGRGRARRDIDVTVTRRNGSTTIRMEESLKGLAGALFGGIMGGVGGGTTGITLGLGTALTHSVAGGVGLWAAALTGTYFLARSLFGRAVHRRAARMREVLDRIAEHVAATAVVTPRVRSASDTPSLPPSNG